MCEIIDTEEDNDLGYNGEPAVKEMNKKRIKKRPPHSVKQRATSLIEIKKLRFSNGYWNGMTQPAQQVVLTLMKSNNPNISIRRFTEITKAIEENYSKNKELIMSPQGSPNELISTLFLFVLVTLEKIGMPIAGGASMMRLNDDENCQTWLVGIPAIDRKITAPLIALRWACSLMNDLNNKKTINKILVMADLKKLIERTASEAPQGVNTLGFLNAAHKLGIPWRHVSSNIYQFGWGKSSRWLDSSFTDQTSLIAAKISLDKFTCAHVLRQSGFPIPTHYLVNSEEQAQEYAEQIGYPVVIKPADCDRGIGVHAGIFSSSGVRSAYKEARKASSSILVEDFIEGNDYRLQVHLGSVFWCALRRPALVVGTGVTTIKELIEETNASREAARKNLDDDPMNEKGFYDIVIDAEAMEWLAAQNLTLDSIPQKGREIRLKGAANVSLGGTRQGIPLDQIHPDNRELVIGAISALRLDIAGVDLIIPNISQSWKISGAAICEVNAKPQLSPHLQRPLLQKMFTNRGLIPIIGVSSPLSEKAKAHILEKMSREGAECQIVDNEEDCWKVLFSQTLAVVIWIISADTFSSNSDTKFLAQGSPIVTFNELILTSDQEQHVSSCSEYFSWGNRKASKVSFLPDNNDVGTSDRAHIKDIVGKALYYL